MGKTIKTILVLGVGPIPIGNPESVYAPGLRTYLFSKLIHEEGFRVITGEAIFGEKDFKAVIDSQEKCDIIEENWERRYLPLEPFLASEIISRWLEIENPEAIVSTTDVSNLASALTKSNIPKYMDFNGPPMVERQEISYICDSDEGLLDQWKYVIPALLTGDQFAACSTPQKFALIGELGAVGRLNKYDSGYDLVDVLPPGYFGNDAKPDGKPAFRNQNIPENSFCLLWTGGFNTWVDEETLFNGIAEAMSKSDRIHFILTGGAIKGHNEKTFIKFKNKVDNSQFKNRFHFFGWVPLKDLSNFYVESNAAINIDRFTYEALLGMRNRILSWMNFELPILTTPLSEFTQMLVSKDLAVGFNFGNPKDLADKLLKMMNSYPTYKDMAKRAKIFLHTEYTNQKLLKPLLDWVKSPKITPDKIQDNLYIIPSGKFKGLAIPKNSLAINHINSLNYSEIEGELLNIKNSRSYKFISAIKKFLGK